MARPRRREPRATLADVARRAGVSATTASFVLSGRTDMRISTRTSDSVRQAARVLDYRPRVGSRMILTERLPAVGFISDTIASEAYAGELIRGGIAEAALQGHTVVVAETEGAAGLEIGPGAGPGEQRRRAVHLRHDRDPGRPRPNAPPRAPDRPGQLRRSPLGPALGRAGRAGGRGAGRADAPRCRARARHLAGRARWATGPFAGPARHGGDRRPAQAQPGCSSRDT